MIVDSYDKLTFTKGHVRRGERLAETAKRETCEEIGLCDLELVARLGRIDIWFVDQFHHQGALIHKYIHYFLFEAPVGSRFKVPKPKRRGEQVKSARWVPASKVLELSEYEDLRPIIKKALKVLKDLQVV